MITPTTGQPAYNSEAIGASTTGTNDDTLVIPNAPGVALPSTGGPGTTSLYLLGGALVLFAVMGFVLRNRLKRAG